MYTSTLRWPDASLFKIDNWGLTLEASWLGLQIPVLCIFANLVFGIMTLKHLSREGVWWCRGKKGESGKGEKREEQKQWTNVEGKCYQPNPYQILKW